MLLHEQARPNGPLVKHIETGPCTEERIQYLLYNMWHNETYRQIIAGENVPDVGGDNADAIEELNGEVYFNEVLEAVSESNGTHRSLPYLTQCLLKWLIYSL